MVSYHRVTIDLTKYASKVVCYKLVSKMPQAYIEKIRYFASQFFSILADRPQLASGAVYSSPPKTLRHGCSLTPPSDW